jgi:hypothetical protein
MVIAIAARLLLVGIVRGIVIARGRGVVRGILVLLANANAMTYQSANVEWIRALLTVAVLIALIVISIALVLRVLGEVYNTSFLGADCGN